MGARTELGARSPELGASSDLRPPTSELSMVVSIFRLIIDPPRSAARNMAVDEMLLLSRSEKGVPVLRFYEWSEPSVTAGYFQDLRRVAGKFNAEKKIIPVVKRLSGGGAVLHGEDLTFSLSIAVSNPFFPTDVKSSYLKINEALRVGLKNDLPKLDYADCKTVAPKKKQSDDRVCFDSPACYDLLLSGKKVLGSSQRRIGKTLLHQSSVFLKLKKELLRRRIAEGFEKVWKVNFKESPLSKKELGEAEKIEKNRYASSEWALLRDLSLRS